MTFRFGASELDAQLTELALARFDPLPAGAFDMEKSVHGFFEIDHPAIRELAERMQTALQFYLMGYESQIVSTHLEGRALVFKPGDYVCTHVDSREADVVCTYFPMGAMRAHSLNDRADPQFVLEDGTRYESEKRLPFEQGHNFYVATEAGAMVLFPGHLPHHQRPYAGSNGERHVQIIGNFTINYINGYHNHYG